MNSLLWQLFDRFVLFLASLNPVTAAKVEKLKAEAAELEAEREKLLARVEAAKQTNISLLLEVAEHNRKRIELENANLHAKEQREQLERQAELDKAAIDARPVDDAIFGGVPKPRN